MAIHGLISPMVLECPKNTLDTAGNYSVKPRQPCFLLIISPAPSFMNILAFIFGAEVNSWVREFHQAYSCGLVKVKLGFRVTLLSDENNQCCLGEWLRATSHSRDVMTKAVKGVVRVILVLDDNWDQERLYTPWVSLKFSVFSSLIELSQHS